MKLDLETMQSFVLAILVVFVTIVARENKNLQTQIDELRIIVNQKTLPALILDKTDFNIR